MKSKEQSNSTSGGMITPSHWFFNKALGWRICPECRDKRLTFVKDNFCPNCGVPMTEPAEYK